MKPDVQAVQAVYFLKIFQKNDGKNPIVEAYPILYTIGVINPSRPDPRRIWKVNVNFLNLFSLRCLERIYESL